MKYVKQFNGGDILAIQLLPEEVSPSEEYLGELHAVLGDSEWFSDRDGSISVNQNGNFLHVPPTHWIVCDEMGIITGLSPSEFERHFQ